MYLGYLCNIKKNSEKLNNRIRYLVFGQAFKFDSASATNFHFGASLVNTTYYMYHETEI